MQIDIDGIKALIQQREPFLMVDSIESVGEDLLSIEGLKSFQQDQWMDLTGRKDPCDEVPFSLLAESMGQVASVLAALRGRKSPALKNRYCLLAQIKDGKFLQPVLRKETLRTVARLERARSDESLYVFRMDGFAGEKLACSAEAYLMRAP